MRRTVAEMVGEFLREAAVLVVVFVPIVRVLERDEPLTFADILITFVLGVGLLTIGMAIERWRE